MGAWVCFEDGAGQGLRPPKGRTWGRRGHTPVVRVTAQGTKRVSLAALICIKADHRPRLIYRIHLDRGPAKGRRKGFTEADYARLLDAAHQQLGGPIVLVWDNLNTHVSRTMRELIAARLWLTVYQLPPYAPELNPVEGVWSHLKRSLANHTKHSLDQLTVASIDTQWWGDLLEAHCKDGFETLAVEVPCCGAATSLDALDYDWPCGFARFEIAVWNPERLWFSEEELTTLGDALGHPVRQIRAHI